MKRKIFYSICVIFLLLLTITIYSNDLSAVFSFPNVFYANLDEIENANNEKKFGSFINLEIGEETKTSTEKYGERVVTVKLFGFIPVRKVVAKILPEEDVYVGGNAIGISMLFDKPIVVCASDLSKKQLQTLFFKEGDVISKVNGCEVDSIDKLIDILKESREDEVEIEYCRNQKHYTQKFKLLKDENNEYKLGLTVKDDISGIGTLTYVLSDSGEFGALGHQLCDNYNSLNIIEGSIYDCNLIGIDKGQSNNPGQLKCVFVSGRNEKGEIKNSNKFGVFGKINNIEELVDINLSAKLGGRLSVKPGKAKIISTVSGIREEYEIEIIKTYNQNKEDDKSFIFRVIDKKLLELTGGIVQGMSGSPIMQNGKIIGAVTHVFTADPTKGFGVFTDWMLSSSECA